jgi:hypothetical protein
MCALLYTKYISYISGWIQSTPLVLEEESFRFLQIVIEE